MLKVIILLAIAIPAYVKVGHFLKSRFLYVHRLDSFFFDRIMDILAIIAWPVLWPVLFVIGFIESR